MFALFGHWLVIECVDADLLICSFCNLVLDPAIS